MAVIGCFRCGDSRSPNWDCTLCNGEGISVGLFGQPTLCPRCEGSGADSPRCRLCGESREWAA